MSILRDHLRRLRSAPTMPPAPVAKPAPAPSAGPKPKPKPKPVPPAQPVAATSKSRPKLPSHGWDLPVIPLTAADVPQAAKTVSGTLLRDTNPQNDRPLVMICTPCTCKYQVHYYPWRSDWPVDTSVRSHQKSRCNKHTSRAGGAWLAIDPGRVEQSLQVVREMREALAAWKAEKANKRIPNPAQESRPC